MSEELDHLRFRRDGLTKELVRAEKEMASWSSARSNISARIADLDKAIAALSPIRPSVTPDRDGNGLLESQSPFVDAEVRNQAEGEAAEPKMFWYASGNEEDFAIGPCGTREEAIEQALDDEVGISTDLKRQVIFIMQAYQEPLKLSRMISVDAILDRAMDGLLGDAAGDEGEPDQLVDHIKQEQWKALEAKLRETMDAWQAEGDIVVTPYVFTRSTKPEAVCYLCVGEEQVVARKWEDAPFEGVMDAKHVADDDTYALINGEWFGPLPEGAHAPIEAAEFTADAERTSVVTDQDRVEQPIPPSPDADVLLENQPGVSDESSSQASSTEAATLGPRDLFLESIMARGGTWHDGGDNPARDWFVDIYVPKASTSLGDQRLHLQGQPANAYVWRGWEVAYVKTQPMFAEVAVDTKASETPSELETQGSADGDREEQTTSPDSSDAQVFAHGIFKDAERKASEPKHSVIGRLFGGTKSFAKAPT